MFSKSTGTYLEAFSGPYIAERSVDEIAKDAVRDLTEGIDDTGIKADVIGEIAWSGPEERPLEKKAWKAYCIAAKKTGYNGPHVKTSNEELMVNYRS
jgi:phosphotriesterase-related protein